MAAILYRDLRLPALETLLARGETHSEPREGCDAWLCRYFGVAKQQDWPVAPLTARYDGIDPGDGYWLRADPVHVSIGRNHQVLSDVAGFGLTERDVQQLAAALQQHFGGEGIEFHAPHPQRWYMRFAAPPRLITTALAAAIDRNVMAHLPHGQDATDFIRIINEAQMALHEHPVNAAREARGEPAINSVWLWGGGTAPAVGAAAVDFVWSGDALALALAQAAGIPANPVPESCATWLAACPAGSRHLLVLDALSAASQRADVAAWRDALVALEQTWFEPLLAALRLHKIAALDMTVINPQATWSTGVAARQLRRWWRRVKPLATYAGAN